MLKPLFRVRPGACSEVIWQKGAPLGQRLVLLTSFTLDYKCLTETITQLILPIRY
jgi:hypothetical protein